MTVEGRCIGVIWGTGMEGMTVSVTTFYSMHVWDS